MRLESYSVILRLLSALTVTKAQEPIAAGDATTARPRPAPHESGPQQLQEAAGTSNRRRSLLRTQVTEWTYRPRAAPSLSRWQAPLATGPGISPAQVEGNNRVLK